MTTTQAPPAKPPCSEGRGMAHHWRYTTPNGSLVHGRCKYCGARRTDHVAPLEGGSWSDYHGLPDPKPDTGGDYYPTGLQERAAP